MKLEFPRFHVDTWESVVIYHCLFVIPVPLWRHDTAYRPDWQRCVLALLHHVHVARSFCQQCIVSSLCIMAFVMRSMFVGCSRAVVVLHVAGFVAVVSPLTPEWFPSPCCCNTSSRFVFWHRATRSGHVMLRRSRQLRFGLVFE